MRTVLAAVAGIAISMAASAGSAQTVYPIDRADILTGARFDFKVEFAGLADPAKISVTLNGKDYAQVFGKAATFVEREAGKDQSALLLRDVLLTEPGTYKVRVTDGVQTRELSWNGLRYRAAQGEERHPVHRRRHVAGASRGGASAGEGHRGGQGVRQARHRRHAADGAGRDRRQRFDHHRLREFRQRLCDRPQDRGQCHGSLRRPHRSTRSTIQRSRPSPAW